MFNKAICSFIISIFFFAPVVLANPYQMNRERFVHLTETEKEEFIILTMELMVEMESKFQQHVSLNGHDDVLYERYTSVMRGLTGLIIGSANADVASSSWEAYAESFQRQLKAGEEKKCFFAGWVSRMQEEKSKRKAHVSNSEVKKYLDAEGVSRKGRRGKVWKDAKEHLLKIKQEDMDLLCVHPSKLRPDHAPERLEYERLNKDCKGEQSSCNPAIFGFKDRKKGTTFCVDASVNASNNASHNCMQKALVVRGKQERDSDSKEDRIQFLKGQLAKEENSVYLESVNNYIMKACVCDSDTEGGKTKELYQGYVNRIRPHRTCYAMMEMLSAVTLCEIPEAPADTIDLTFFKDIKTHTARRPNIHERKGAPKALEDHYKRYLKEIKDTKAYKKICENIPDPVPVPVTVPEPEPIPVSAPIPKAKIYKCKVLECSPEQAAVSDKVEGPKKTSFVSDFVDGAKKFVAAVTKKADAQPQKLKTCKISIHEEGDDKDENSIQETVSGVGGSDVEKLFTPKAGTAEVTVTCTLPPDVIPEENPLSTCSIDLSGEETEITATLKLELQEGDKMVDVDWGKGPVKDKSTKLPFNKNEGIIVSSTVNVKRDSGPYEIKCENNKEAVAKEDPTLKLSAGAKTASSQSIKAEAKGDFEDWNIVWSSKGSGAPKTEKKKEIDYAGDSSSEEEELEADEKSTEAIANTFSKTEAAKPESEVDQPRATEDYEICAKLEMDEKSVDGGCVTVPKLETAASAPVPEEKVQKPVMQFQQLPPPGPPPVQRRFNTDFSVEGSR